MSGLRSAYISTICQHKCAIAQVGECTSNGTKATCSAVSEAVLPFLSPKMDWVMPITLTNTTVITTTHTNTATRSTTS